ncbi:MAG: FAD binding domain-containing protein [Ilumatobacteraceae bacterium]
MPTFEYHDPDELEEVLSLLAELGDEAKVISGGQSLLPLLATRLAQPAHLVDLGRVVGLRSLQDQGDHVAFGATTSEGDAERSAIVQDRLPLLAEALPFIGHVAIRNRGTIAGSLAHADPAAELPAVLVALGGEVVVRSVRGERIVQADDLFRGYLTTSLDDDEVIVEVRLPTAPPASGW